MSNTSKPSNQFKIHQIKVQPFTRCWIHKIIFLSNKKKKFDQATKTTTWYMIVVMTLSKIHFCIYFIFWIRGRGLELAQNCIANHFWKITFIWCYLFFDNLDWTWPLIKRKMNDNRLNLGIVQKIKGSFFILKK